MSTIAWMLDSCLKRTSPFIRFLLVGVINTATGLTIMLVLLELLRWPYMPATLAGNAVGAAVSYILNRSFTFRSNASVPEALPRFITVILLCYMFSYGTSRVAAGYLLPIWMQGFFSADVLAVFMGTALYTISNYAGQKYWVFRQGTGELV
ncbi:GtrA family protein [Mesobacillus zeae]|nr:GtrA family protein [Mesobacillus zeae]